MARRLSDAWLDDLRSRVNIVDVVSEYVQLKPKGRRYWGVCPFHNEKTASFSVDQDAQLFYCFGCHKGGNVVHFVMEMERMAFLDAVTMLSERAHFPLPTGADDGPPADNEGERALKDAILSANLAAARRFHELIWTPVGAKALAYLHRRGLTDGDIRKFGLGAAADGWTDLTDYLGQNGFEADVLVAAGLAVRKETRVFDMFRDRVVFPIINAQGRVLGFGGRVLGDGNPKYLNTPDTKVFNKRQGLYAMNFVRQERGLKRLVLVEGYMDVVSLRKAGVPGVVATLGTALTEEQARLIKRFAPEVWVAYDGDEAGQKAIERALSIFEEQRHPARVVVFPEGQDPDDFVTREGAAGFERLRPIAPTDYRLRRMAKGYDLTDGDGRAKYAIEACALLRKEQNPVELEGYLSRLMMETGFPRETLLAQIGVRSAAPAASPKPAYRERAPVENEAQRAQRTLVMLLAQRLIPSDAVQVSDFDEPLYREAVDLLKNGIAPDAVLERVSESNRPALARAFSDETPPDPQKALAVAQDCRVCIQQARVEEEISRVRLALKTAEPAAQAPLKARLLALIKQK